MENNSRAGCTHSALDWLTEKLRIVLVITDSVFANECPIRVVQIFYSPANPNPIKLAHSTDE